MGKALHVERLNQPCSDFDQYIQEARRETYKKDCTLIFSHPVNGDHWKALKFGTYHLSEALGGYKDEVTRNSATRENPFAPPSSIEDQHIRHFQS